VVGGEQRFPSINDLLSSGVDSNGRQGARCSSIFWLFGVSSGGAPVDTSYARGCSVTVPSSGCQATPEAPSAAGGAPRWSLRRTQQPHLG